MNTARHERRYAVLFLAPSLAGFLLFYFVPFIASFYYSLIDNSISKHFVGVDNYVQLLSNPSFKQAGINTFMFTAVCVPLNLMLPLCLAIMVNQKIYSKKVLRTFFISPLVVPVASVVLVWSMIFDYRGFLNSVITAFGFKAVDWMKTDWARVVVMVVYLWKNAGYNMVLFLAGLQNIPVEYYEWAQMEGANLWQRFRRITLVYLTPTLYFVFIISIINSFKVFRETYLISGEYPHESIYMLQHYMNNVFTALDYQKLTSAATVMAVIVNLLVAFLFVFERKIRETIS